MYFVFRDTLFNKDILDFQNKRLLELIEKSNHATHTYGILKDNDSDLETNRMFLI